jgi:LuxR family transcriptional regulator, maltose regulon positive regulatory protein
VTVGLVEGRAALDRGAWEAAREAFEAALERGETPEALEGLGWALFWLDRTEEGLACRERAFRLHRERGDVRSAARVACGLAVDGLDFHGVDHATAWLERARRLLDGVDSGPERGWVSLWEGHFALMHGRDTARAREHGREALEVARAERDADLERLAVALEGLVCVAEGRVEEGMRRVDEAATAALAGEVGHLDAVGATCCFLVHACERVRDYDRASRWAERVQRFSREWGIVPALTVCRTQHAAMLIGRGEWAAAEEELQRTIERLSESRPLLAAEGLEQLAELRRRQGRWEEAEELYARVEGRSLALLGRSTIALDRGDHAGAADMLERFLRRTPPDNWNGRATALEMLVRARLALGQEAQEALDSLRGLAERVPTPMVRAAAALAEGGLAAASLAWEEARKRHEDAVDLMLAAPAPYEASRARLDLARCLAGAGRGGPAQQEARSALESFQRLGAARDALRAERLLEELRRAEAAPAARGPSAGGSPLSPREIEVLRLVAEGLSDKEIAGRLHLSGHTVHRHLSNVRRKLGLPSRAAAVGWAAQNRLL